MHSVIPSSLLFLHNQLNFPAKRYFTISGMELLFFFFNQTTSVILKATTTTLNIFKPST